MWPRLVRAGYSSRAFPPCVPPYISRAHTCGTPSRTHTRMHVHRALPPPSQPPCCSTPCLHRTRHAMQCPYLPCSLTRVSRHPRGRPLLPAFRSNGGRTENSITLEDVPPSLVAIKRYMRDQRPTSTGWSNLADRYVKYKAANTGSLLLVTYSDTIGQHMTGHASACGTRILVNGKSPVGANEFRSHSSTLRGWRIWPGSFRWVVPATMVKKGQTYAVQVQNQRHSGTSECLYGWSNNANHNILSVEEITPDAQKLMAFTKPGSFSDTRPKKTSWENVAQRTLVYVRTFHMPVDNSLIALTRHGVPLMKPCSLRASPVCLVKKCRQVATATEASHAPSSVLSTSLCRYCFPGTPSSTKIL